MTKYGETADDHVISGDTSTALNKVIDAWESVRGGRNHDIQVIQRWLVEDMKPAMDNARKVLGREIPTA